MRKFMCFSSSSTWLSTNVGMEIIRRISWNPTIRQTSLIAPFIRLLCLPCPLKPSLALLKCDHLRFPVLTEEIFVALTECCRLASQPLATAYTGRPRESALIARASTASVEIFSAIVGRRRPFTNDDPEWGGLKVVCVATRRLDMLRITHLVSLSWKSDSILRIEKEKERTATENMS